MNLSFSIYRCHKLLHVDIVLNSIAINNRQKCRIQVELFTYNLNAHLNLGFAYVQWIAPKRTFRAICS